MKDILTAPFVKEMCDTTANMYRLGWDERNGGNISYMLDEEEVAQYLDINHVLREIPTGVKADALIGRIFIVTGTGKYFKNVKGIPEKLIASIMCKCCKKLKPTGKETVSWNDLYKCMRSKLNNVDHPNTIKVLDSLIKK